MKVQSIQPTPNPSAFKFFVDHKLTERVRNYASAAEADGDALAQALFALPGVDTLFFCDDFVTVSMSEGAPWRTVHKQVMAVLENHAAPLLRGNGAAVPVAEAAGDPALLQRINDVLDDRVRPALAGDGGGLEVLGLDGKTLRIRYQGACGSCPSSIAGTLAAIQNLLQSEIDELLQVVNG